MPAIHPCLWFATEAEAAANFYVSIFPNSEVGRVLRGGGAAIAIDFTLDGRPMVALNGRQEPGFTDASSLMVPCASQEEVDRYWHALLADGGQEGRCGWLTDRFGVSWQVFPEEMGTLLGDSDPARAGRAMQAMMGMRKIDLAAIRRARDGAVG